MIAVAQRGAPRDRGEFGLEAGGDELRYENCNRFYLKDRLFHRVYVYMSGDNLLQPGDA